MTHSFYNGRNKWSPKCRYFSPVIMNNCPKFMSSIAKKRENRLRVCALYTTDGLFPLLKCKNAIAHVFTTFEMYL